MMHSAQNSEVEILSMPLIIFIQFDDVGA